MTFSAMLKAFKRDMPLIMDGKDPHRYPRQFAAIGELHDILAKVADHYRLSISALQGPGGNWAVSHPRHVYCFLARTRTYKSHKQIGEVINRETSTVNSSVRTVRKRLESDPDMAEAVRVIGDKL